ncbi:MAG: BMC domain-containing protein [Cellulosilyticaceae bacterium]
MQAIGVLEVVGNVAAIEALDTMLKSAQVELVTAEKKLGGRLVSIVVRGSVSDVKEAIEQAKLKVANIGRVAAEVIIPNPHEEVEKLLNYSARKIRK